MFDSTPSVDAAKTPILAGMYPDPSICRVGSDYYLVNSSMEYSPGAPLWHSEDLTSWELVGNALSDDSLFPSGTTASSAGMYAPTLRHHEGRFYLITTLVRSGNYEQVLLTSDRIEGPWDGVISIPGIVGIDPDIAWDEDGKCLVSFCAWDETGAGIKQAEIDPSSGRLLSDPAWIWMGSGLSNSEGPHLFRRGQWWYLLIAEGGTARGHVVSVARSASPRGPFIGAPQNPIFTRRSTQHPVQNVGHADMVELPDGSWAAVYLGVRPRGISPKFHVNGRETFISGIDWVDAWPVFVDFPRPVKRHPTNFSDRFDDRSLHPRWISPGINPSLLSDFVPDGLAVHSATAPSGLPSGVFTRVSDEAWSSVWRVRPGAATSRLIVQIDERHWYGLRFQEGQVEAISHVGDVEAVVASRVLPESSEITVVMSAGPGGSGPDRVTMGLMIDGNVDSLAVLDGRYLSTEVAGGFTGRSLGFVVDQGQAILREVDYSAVDD